MYNGFGNYGRGGGGQETMMIMVCCVCCVCLLSVLGGYFTNMFCGISSSLGKSCPPKETTPPPQLPVVVPSDTEEPSVATTLQTCAKAVSKAARNSNDPRPEIQPASCQGVARMQGRDCFYWTVDKDQVTGLARWVRVNDGDTDAYNPNCTPVVKCDTKINFTNPEMGFYREDNPSPMIKLGNCKAVAVTATNRTATLTQLTAAAKAVGVRTYNYGPWDNVKSRILYDRIAGYIGQTDMMVAINNAKRAMAYLKQPLMFSDQLVPMDAFAYTIEAAVRTLVGDSGWVYNMAVLMRNTEHRTVWQNQTQRSKWNYWIQFLRKAVPAKDRRIAMQDWTKLTQAVLPTVRAPNA